MNKLMMLFCAFVMVACNNQDATPAADQSDTAGTNASINTTSLSRESEMEILDECISNAKDNAGNDLDNARAYSLCRCVLLQMQEKYPGADSTALVNYLRDTTQVVELAKKCE
jgi:hypothetical protein